MSFGGWCNGAIRETTEVRQTRPRWHHLLFLILGFGLNIARYFILQRISNSVATLRTPLDEKRIEEVLGTVQLDDAQRRFFWLRTMPS